MTTHAYADIVGEGYYELPRWRFRIGYIGSHRRKRTLYVKAALVLIASAAAISMWSGVTFAHLRTV